MTERLIRVDVLSEELGLNLHTAYDMAEWLRRMEGIDGPVVGGEQPICALDGTVLGHMPLITEQAADALRRRIASTRDSVADA